MKNLNHLTDEELEDCVDGTTNINMIRDILTKHGVVDGDGYIDPEIFADWFAQGIQGYIDAEQDSEEWSEANDTNWNWGYDIADNINSYISDNFTNGE
ncbi:MAG: hypothetical protein EBU90_16250 [Proteobacteria bacterium]|nr:hypothetical protein [Pseudomonadota bacterium]